MRARVSKWFAVRGGSGSSAWKRPEIIGRESETLAMFARHTRHTPQAPAANLLASHLLCYFLAGVGTQIPARGISLPFARLPRHGHVREPCVCGCKWAHSPILYSEAITCWSVSSKGDHESRRIKEKERNESKRGAVTVFTADQSEKYQSKEAAMRRKVSRVCEIIIISKTRSLCSLGSFTGDRRTRESALARDKY